MVLKATSTHLPNNRKGRKQNNLRSSRLKQIFPHRQETNSLNQAAANRNCALMKMFRFRNLMQNPHHNKCLKTTFLSGRPSKRHQPVRIFNPASKKFLVHLVATSTSKNPILLIFLLGNLTKIHLKTMIFSTKAMNKTTIEETNNGVLKTISQILMTTSDHQPNDTKL